MKNHFLYMWFHWNFTSKKVILHLPTQLNTWCRSLCERINETRKQINLSFRVLKSIGFQGKNVFFFHKIVSKIDLPLRPQLTFWNICMGNPKNPIWSFEIKFIFVEKTNQKRFGKFQFCSSFVRKRLLSEMLGFPIFFSKKMEFKFPNNKIPKTCCYSASLQYY